MKDMHLAILRICLNHQIRHYMNKTQISSIFISTTWIYASKTAKLHYKKNMWWALCSRTLRNGKRQHLKIEEMLQSSWANLLTCRRVRLYIMKLIQELSMKVKWLVMASIILWDIWFKRNKNYLITKNNSMKIQINRLKRYKKEIMPDLKEWVQLMANTWEVQILNDK